MRNITDLTKFQVKIDFTFIKNCITLYPARTNIPGCIEEVMDYIDKFICDYEDVKVITINPSRR